MAGQKFVIETSLGQLRGQTSVSKISGKIYYGCLGIPFAKPPLGELRFKAPQPFGSWEGIRDALENGNDPVQDLSVLSITTDSVNFAQGNEDCLYLNVFMNQLPTKGGPKKPVMVNIHGGGFAGGNGSTKMAGPDNLLEGDIIFVSLNYRCGALGFMSLENETVPGNAGLKDQTLALKWVQDNIHSFGGDPNNVTIFGISAGGASVDLQLISPLSKGLFHKAIVQSGFSTNPWVSQRNPKALAVNLAKKIGCTSENDDEVLKFLQSATVEEIILATKQLSQEKEFKRFCNFLFTPCTEIRQPGAFLTDSPETLLKKGEFHKVPVILGAAATEGSLAPFDGLNDEKLENLNRNPDQLVPEELKLKPGSDEHKKATKEILDFYFDGKPISWESSNSYIQYVGDCMFNTGLERTRTRLVQKSTAPVYTYLFKDHSKCMCSAMNALFPENYSKFVKPEACHGSDMMYLFTFTMLGPYELSDEDKEKIKKHVTAWTNFAYHNDPNCKELGVTWEKDSVSKPCFMEIGKTWTLRRGIPFEDRITFWKNLYSKYHVS